MVHSRGPSGVAGRGTGQSRGGGADPTGLGVQAASRAEGGSHRSITGHWLCGQLGATGVGGGAAGQECWAANSGGVGQGCGRVRWRGLMGRHWAWQGGRLGKVHGSHSS